MTCRQFGEKFFSDRNMCPTSRPLSNLKPQRFIETWTLFYQAGQGTVYTPGPGTRVRIVSNRPGFTPGKRDVQRGLRLTCPCIGGPQLHRAHAPERLLRWATMAGDAQRQYVPVPVVPYGEEEVRFGAALLACGNAVLRMTTVTLFSGSWSRSTAAAARVSGATPSSSKRCSPCENRALCRHRLHSTLTQTRSGGRWQKKHVSTRACS